MSTTAATPRHGQSAHGHEDAPLAAAKTPVSSGLLPFVGVLWALAVVALGGVLVREALVHTGAVDGPLYIDKSVDYLDGRAPEDWMVVAAVVAAVVGLLLVALALRPRRRNELALEAQTGVFLTTRSVRRIATAAASGADGVDTSSVTATRGRVSIDATSLAPDTAGAKSRIEEDVRSALSALRKPPTVKASVRSTGGAA